MWILSGVIQFKLLYSSSLKDKRNTVRTIKAKLNRVFSLAAAEVADRDVHNFGSIGFCGCSADRSRLEELSGKLDLYLGELHELRITGFHRSIVRYSDIHIDTGNARPPDVY